MANDDKKIAPSRKQLMAALLKAVAPPEESEVVKFARNISEKFKSVAESLNNILKKAGFDAEGVYTASKEKLNKLTEKFNKRYRDNDDGSKESVKSGIFNMFGEARDRAASKISFLRKKLPGSDTVSPPKATSAELLAKLTEEQQLASDELTLARKEAWGAEQLLNSSSGFAKLSAKANVLETNKNLQLIVEKHQKLQEDKAELERKIQLAKEIHRIRSIEDPELRRQELEKTNELYRSLGVPELDPKIAVSLAEGRYKPEDHDMDDVEDSVSGGLDNEGYDTSLGDDKSLDDGEEGDSKEKKRGRYESAIDKLLGPKKKKKPLNIKKKLGNFAGRFANDPAGAMTRLIAVDLPFALMKMYGNVMKHALRETLLFPLRFYRAAKGLYKSFGWLIKAPFKLLQTVGKVGLGALGINLGEATGKTGRLFGRLLGHKYGENQMGADGEPKKDKWWKFWQRKKKREDEVAEETEAAKKNAKGEGKEKKGIIGRMIDAFTNLTRTVMAGGVAFMFKDIAWGWFLKPAIQGLTSTISAALAPLLAPITKPIANAYNKTKNFLGDKKKAAGKFLKSNKDKLLKQGGKLAGRLAVRSGVIGGAAMAIGGTAAAVLGSPVVATGLVVWGGYEAYKVFRDWNKNNIPENVTNDLALFRLMAYGVSESDASDNELERFKDVLNVETIYRFNSEWDSSEEAFKMKQLDGKTVREIASILGYRELKDGQLVPLEPDDQERVLKWINKSSKIFMEFMTALRFVNQGADLNKLEGLRPSEVHKLLNMISGITNYSDDKTLPFPKEGMWPFKKAKESDVTHDNLKQELDKLLNKYLTLSKSENSADASWRAKRDAAMDKYGKGGTPVTPGKGKVVGLDTGASKADKIAIDNAKENQSSSSGDAEDKPKGGSSGGGGGRTRPKFNLSELKEADGDLFPGGDSLKGIKLHDGANIFGLDPIVFELFTGMANEYNEKTGKTIQVNRGWSSMQDQEKLYKADIAKNGGKPSGKVASPGGSLHEYGLAIDINSDNMRELDELGLLRKYGFSTAVGKETWHLEPIGLSLDPKRAKTDIEWRTEQLLNSPGRGGGGYGLDPDALKYKRDITLQQSIFDSDNAKIIESEEKKESLKTNTASKTSPDVKKELTKTPPKPPAVASSNSGSQPKPSFTKTVNGEVVEEYSGPNLTREEALSKGLVAEIYKDGRKVRTVQGNTKSHLETKIELEIGNLKLRSPGSNGKFTYKILDPIPITEKGQGDSVVQKNGERSSPSTTTQQGVGVTLPKNMDQGESINPAVAAKASTKAPVDKPTAPVVPVVNANVQIDNEESLSKMDEQTATLGKIATTLENILANSQATVSSVNGVSQANNTQPTPQSRQGNVAKTIPNSSVSMGRNV